MQTVFSEWYDSNKTNLTEHKKTIIIYFICEILINLIFLFCEAYFLYVIFKNHAIYRLQNNGLLSPFVGAVFYTSQLQIIHI